MNNVMALKPATGLSGMVKTFPKSLDVDAEVKLFKLYQETKDVESYKKIVYHNLRFVAYVVSGFRTHIDKMELFQEGTVGLMTAIDKFDLSVGVRFVSFAVRYIKSALNDYILCNISTVKSLTTKPMRKLFFNQNIVTINGSSISGIKKTAESLNVTPKDVDDFLIRKAGIYSEPIMVQDDLGDSEISNIDDIGYDLLDGILIEEEYVNNTHMLNDILGGLTERDRDILEGTYLRKEPLRVLSERWGVSMERIRQLKEKTIKKIKEEIYEND